MITLICEGCSKEFTVQMPYEAKERRFCSRPCFYKWNTGPEHNSQWTQKLMECDHCGKSFYKKACLIGTYNYCSDPCARAEHGKKITGPQHPNWKGGVIYGRGSRWRATREKVLERQGSKCFDCGMTEAEHKAKYGASLHVHHISPYRLTLDSSPDNLIALCIPCHGIEESASHRGLSPDDYRKMRKYDKEARAKGFYRDDYSRVYDSCPRCGGRKAKKALRCRKCKNAEATYNVCPICHGPKSDSTAKKCWDCHIKIRRGELVVLAPFAYLDSRPPRRTAAS